MGISEHYRQLALSDQNPSVTNQKAADLMCRDMLLGVARLLVEDGEKVPMFGRDRNLIKDTARVAIIATGTLPAILLFANPLNFLDHLEWERPRSTDNEGSVKLSSQTAAIHSRFFKQNLKVRVDGLDEGLKLMVSDSGKPYGVIDKQFRINQLSLWIPYRRANLEDATKFWVELANYLPTPK